MLSRGLKLLVNNLDRLLFTMVGLVAIYYLPLWFVVLFGAIGMVIFNYYWELVVCVAVLELVFTPETVVWSPWYFQYTIILLIILASIETVRQRVRV